MQRIKFIEVASELGAGTHGACLGVGALKATSLIRKSDCFKKYPSLPVATLNEQLFKDIVHPFAKHIPQHRILLERTASAVKQVLAEGSFPVILGGDHASAAGTIFGLREAHPGKRLGVVWIDAHADLHTPFTTPSGNLHGMPLALVLGIDNLECRLHHPSAETVAEWNKIKAVGGPGPKLNPQDIVFISMRDLEAPEQAIIDRYGICNIPVEEVRSKGVEAIVQEVMKTLQACDMLYVSFDVDSLDPDLVSRGTGTPYPDGLSLKEGLELNRQLAAQPKVVCWEMVEINPLLDTENKMGFAALQVLEACLQARETAAETADLTNKQ